MPKPTKAPTSQQSVKIPEVLDELVKSASKKGELTDDEVLASLAKVRNYTQAQQE